MDHSHIVQAGDLDRYAPTRDCQEVIPELVYWLVKQSCPDIAICRIPYGDAINQPGADGLVQTDGGFLEFVPKGKSYWEIGTGNDPQGKATEDFKKRTDELDELKRAESSFVFVTPRSAGSGGWNEPEQTKWVERRTDEGWKFIRVIDGVKLADWLREHPGIGMWMAKKMNLTGRLGGLSTASEHWEDMISEHAADDPPFPAQLFTVGRAGACEALQALFEGKTHVLKLFAESPLDVADFVAAFLESLAQTDREISRSFSNRCLYISDEQAWRSIVETRSSQVLVADPRLGLETDEGAVLQTIARRKGHSVIVPLCGAWSGNSPEILRLRSPSSSQIEATLKESAYSEMRAKELGRIGGDRISALRRYLRGYGMLPPYATWQNATLIAQAGLVGAWDGSNGADRSALEILLGKGYGEWIETLRPETLRSDSPLVQRDEKWRFVARSEAWNFLGSRICDEDLDRFRKMAVSVLEIRDPKFDLPKEQRFAASIHDKSLPNSDSIRKGIAESLSLMGSRPGALSSCTLGKAEATAVLVVRQLLNQANWERWASLDSLMPLLAEAAPNEFLDSVEAALVDLKTAPFHNIFAEEGNGAFGGWNYMSGLLWALETLAWSPDYLSRVSVILADIASIDPGGNWSNRPSNSLADIFLPWHVQTTAPFDKRLSAVKAVLKEQPEVGWSLLLALLPHNHGFTSGCHRPIWREFIPRNWKESVLRSEYWEQIAAFTELAISLAKSNSEKLCELIRRLPDLPKAAHESVLSYLESGDIVSLSEMERLPLWESLDALVKHHRKFSAAEWALPVEAVNKIAGVAQQLEPRSPEFKYQHLFSDRDFDLFDDNGSIEEQQKRLDEARNVAVSEILRNANLDGVLKFAAQVDTPYQVGLALGQNDLDEIDLAVLPAFLDSEDEILKRVVAGFIWARFWKFKEDWVDKVLERESIPGHRAKILTYLPFDFPAWKRVASHLKGADEEALYWKNVRVNPYGPARDLTLAAKRLLQYGREGAAVLCIARMVDNRSEFDEALATEALLAVLESEQGFKELDIHHTLKIIKRLQKSEASDKNALFKIEWNFLPWLDRFSAGSPVTLEKRLSSDPMFFAEVIGLVFRSKKSETDGKEPDEQKKRLAMNAYKLLMEWKRCPGIREDNSFSAEEFNLWINDARRITEESGHAEVAQIQIGHVLAYAPRDTDGLWIDNAVAETLNFRDTGEMRSGFTTELFNQRGTHGFTHGREERELAKGYRANAEALDSRGYSRFATAMREFAEQYERDAEREARRNPFED